MSRRNLKSDFWRSNRIHPGWILPYEPAGNRIHPGWMFPYGPAGTGGVNREGGTAVLRRRVTRGLTLLLCSTLLLCGCSFHNENPVLSEAAKQIQTLHYDEAIAKLKNGKGDLSKVREAKRLLGIAYLKKGSYKKAAATLKKALSMSNGLLCEEDFDLSYYLAQCYRKMGKAEEAQKVYEHILALRPHDLTALYEMGATKLAAGDLTGAAASLDKAVNEDPGNLDLRIRIFQMYAQNGKEDTGKAVLSEARNRYGSKLSAYDRGRLDFYLGNNAEAQSGLEKALAQAGEKEKAGIALLLGQTGEKQGQYQYAIDIYSSVLKAGEPDARLYNRRALCRMALKEYAEAITDLEAGLARKDPSASRTLLRNEVTAYEYSGDFTKAKEKMKEYLSLYPEDAEAQREEIFLSTRNEEPTE